LWNAGGESFFCVSLESTTRKLSSLLLVSLSVPRSRDRSLEGTWESCGLVGSGNPLLRDACWLPSKFQLVFSFRALRVPRRRPLLTSFSSSPLPFSAVLRRQPNGNLREDPSSQDRLSSSYRLHHQGSHPSSPHRRPIKTAGESERRRHGRDDAPLVLGSGLGKFGEEADPSSDHSSGC